MGNVASEESGEGESSFDVQKQQSHTRQNKAQKQQHTSDRNRSSNVQNNLERPLHNKIQASNNPYIIPTKQRQQIASKLPSENKIPYNDINSKAISKLQPNKEKATEEPKQEVIKPENIASVCEIKDIKPFTDKDEYNSNIYYESPAIYYSSKPIKSNKSRFTYPYKLFEENNKVNIDKINKQHNVLSEAVINDYIGYSKYETSQANLKKLNFPIELISNRATSTLKRTKVYDISENKVIKEEKPKTRLDEFRDYIEEMDIMKDTKTRSRMINVIHSALPLYLRESNKFQRIETSQSSNRIRYEQSQRNRSMSKYAQYMINSLINNSKPNNN